MDQHALVTAAKKFNVADYPVEKLVFDPDTIIPNEDKKAMSKQAADQKKAMIKLSTEELSKVFALRNQLKKEYNIVKAEKRRLAKLNAPVPETHQTVRTSSQHAIPSLMTEDLQKIYKGGRF